MIKFRMDGLGISMSCALDKYGHHPCRKRRDRMPFEGLGREDKPKCGIHRYHKENTGARREYAQSGEKSTNIGSHRTKRTHDCAYKFRKLASRCVAAKVRAGQGFQYFLRPRRGRAQRPDAHRNLCRAPMFPGIRNRSNPRSSDRPRGCWTVCQNKQGWLAKSCSRGCPANFPRPSTTTHREANSRLMRRYRE
jgi:hypothetical protein